MQYHSHVIIMTRSHMPSATIYMSESILVHKRKGRVPNRRFRIVTRWNWFFSITTMKAYWFRITHFPWISSPVTTVKVCVYIYMYILLLPRYSEDLYNFRMRPGGINNGGREELQHPRCFSHGSHYVHHRGSYDTINGWPCPCIVVRLLRRYIMLLGTVESLAPIQYFPPEQILSLLFVCLLYGLSSELLLLCIYACWFHCQWDRMETQNYRLIYGGVALGGSPEFLNTAERHRL
jgi:hypothetical protein